MPYYAPPTAEPTTVPPEEELPPEEVVAPEAAAPVGGAEWDAQAAPAPAAETPAAAPVSGDDWDAQAGPFTGAVQGIQSGLGQAVAPIQEALPEPVRNLTDIVGQPVGGALDAVTGVTTALGQGDLPGAALAALEPAMAPQMRAREQAGTRVAEGLPVAPNNEFLEDPGSALAILPSLVLGTGAAAGGGPDINEWFDTLNPADQQALRDAGGNAVVDAYLTSLDASPIPPPQLVNPLDAGAIDAGPLARGKAILGDVDDFLGGYGTAAREGALGPFLKNQLIETAMDPLLLVPPAVGAKVGSTVGRATRAALPQLPGMAGALDLAPPEVARLQAEEIGTAAGELLPALRAAEHSGVVPAAGLTPGAIPTPSSNGRLAPSPDLGQASAAAPPIPPPGPRLPGWPQYEHVRLDPNAPMRPRSPISGRPIIEPGSRPELEVPMRRHLDSMGLTDVGLRIVNDLRDVGPDVARAGVRPTDLAVYSAERRVIGISLDAARAADYPRLIDHEAVHALSYGGLFRGNEFQTLVDAADRMGIRTDIERTYQGANASTIAEEMVAELYTRWRSGEAVPAPALPLLQRIAQFLLGLGRGLRDAYPEDVLKAMQSGKIGSRTRRNVPGSWSLKPTDPAFATVYHGSGRPGLDTLRGDVPMAERNNPNAASLLGVFTTPIKNYAEKYGRMATTGERRIYTADVELTNPFRMPQREFYNRFVQYDYHAMLEAQAFRRTLMAQGFDGIHVFDEFSNEIKPDIPPHLQDVVEIVSFADVPVVAEAAFSRAAAANAAYGNAPAEARAAVAAVPNPQLTRHAAVVSDPAARDLAQSAEGVFRFADGYRPGRGMTVEEVFIQTLNDVEYWANADDITNPRWLELDKRFNPDGTFDRETFRGPATDAATRELRDQHAFAVFEDALQRALPRNAPKSTLEYLNQQYLGTVRRTMLFNPLRLPSYVLQNLITNSVNVGARIGPRAVVDLWTKPSEMVKGFRNARSLGEGKATYHTTFGSMQSKMKVGTKPNIPMSHAAYFDRLGGKPPKWLERVQRALAPNTSRYIGTMADQLPREVAGTRVLQREYRRLNRELPGKVRKELYDRGVFVPEAKAYQVIRDFLDAERTITDRNTGAPIRTMLGAREAKFEPIWAADDFGTYLKEHLTEDMRDPPDAAALDRAIDRIVRDSKNRHRAILDEADRQVDNALFAWRNTNADEMAGKLFLYHYWTSHQGGLYVTEALKRPYMLSAYGRMMDEFEAQAEELGQPPWMKGFFQLQNSVAGYSTWFSPFDLVQSLLTFADWQYGQDDNAKYKDLTALGKGAGMAPFLIHPLLQMAAYSLGLLGPDYYAPPVTGAETYGAKAIDVLNLANAQGKLPTWVNEMGIGVDANGNKVPIPVRPLQELYARVGNAVSTAFAPITGLSPVEVSNMGGSWERNIASIAETNYRNAHPEADQMTVNRDVTDILADHASPEYQAALRKAADMPFSLSEGLPGLVAGAARIASPVRVYNWPEQYNLDRWNLTPSASAPGARNIPHLGEMDPATGELTPAGERAQFVDSAARYGATATPEARHLANLQNEYYALEPLDYAEANDVAGDIYYGMDGPVTVAGVEYTPEQVAAMSSDDRYALGTQALADAGYTREDQQGFRDAQARFLADNPDFAAYQEFKKLVGYTEEEQRQFVTETALTNPSYAQFVRTDLMNHETGQIDYGAAGYVDSYLASQGTRPSVYSPLVGNEPSRVPGGYPELAGHPSGQPLLPQMTQAASEPFTIYTKPLDPNEYVYPDEVAGAIDPALAERVEVIAGPDPEFGMVKVRIGDQIGYVDQAFLASTSPPQPTAAPGPAPAPVQPQGGLAGLAGGVVNALGAVKDGISAVIGTTTPDGKPGPQMSTDSIDGLVQSVVPTGQFKGYGFRAPAAKPLYDYFAGHGGSANEHTGIDISASLGDPVRSPVAGTVVCGGTGNGSGVNGSGCAEFQDVMGNGAGRVEVLMDDGTTSYIFGHMSTSALQPGDRVEVGQQLGAVGGYDGAHIHLEKRTWNGGTYTIVDPVGASAPAPPAQGGGLLGAIGSIFSGGGTTPATDTMGTAANPGDHYGDLPLSGGDWSVLDQYNAAYPAASEQVAAETGTAVPTDLIKALNAMESGYGRINPPTGVRTDVRDKPLAGFVGVFKDAADSWGADFERMTTDPEYAIYGMTLGLARIANWDAAQYGAPSGTVYENYGWDGVLAIYYSGQPHLDEPQPADDTTTVRQYVDNINAMRAEVRGS
jgi:hypothetical protein